MLHNYTLTAFRNLAHQKLQLIITVGGLMVAFTAATLIALFVRDELTYDRFWPQSARIYIVTTTLALPGEAPMRFDAVPAPVARQLRTALPASDGQVVRLMHEGHTVRHGAVESNESIFWADPDFFAVLRPKVLAGDLDTALSRPDGVVLSERLARKYLGRSDPIGETLQIDRADPVRVAAVIADLPSTTHLAADIFASGLANFSSLGNADAQTGALRELSVDTATYLKLAPQTSPARAVNAVHRVLAGYLESLSEPDLPLSVKVVPIRDLHLSPPALGAERRGDSRTVYGISVIALLIIAVAAINFVTLLTARAARRSKEIAVRKAHGAHRRDLVIQFVGEAVIHAILALVLALPVVKLIAPDLGAFLQRDLSFEFGRDLGLIVLLFGISITTGVLAGIYPAVVLASLSPVTALKGGPMRRSGSAGLLRNTLVAVQFAVLIVLMIGTTVVYRQVHFALNEGLRLDKDQVLVVVTDCKGALEAEVRKVAGVRGVTCSQSAPVRTTVSTGTAVASNGRSTTVVGCAVEPGFFELYGLRPLAGRFFRNGQQPTASVEGGGNLFSGPVVINETAVRRFGFASARAAVGQSVRRPAGPHSSGVISEIIGVVGDFPVGSVRTPIDATVFHFDPTAFSLMSIKLTGRDIPESLAAIDGLWKSLGEPHPIRRFFVDQYVQDEYLDEVRQGQLIGVFAAVALLISSLGLFGLSEFNTQNRIKEVGIRKALGAGNWNIVALLLWQMSYPVLWASLVAWPLAYYLMSRWLEGFAYRIGLDAWPFIASSAAALLIACLTVLGHSVAAARRKPIMALRYE